MGGLRGTWRSVLLRVGGEWRKCVWSEGVCGSGRRVEEVCVE